MGACKLVGEKETGGLNNNLSLYCIPFEIGRILLSGHADLFAIHDECTCLGTDLMIENAVYGVVLKHVGEILGIEKVVDTYNLDVVSEIVNSSTEDHTSDTAESVNTKFYHF